MRKDNQNDNRASGGVAILTSLNYVTTTLNLSTNLQAVAVRVHTDKLITVCSLYLPPSETIIQRDLDDLVEQLPTPFIILGDMNAHSMLWGNSNSNRRGEQVEKFVSDNSLCILNDDSHTYFHTPTHTFHSIDLAICSPCIFPLLTFSVSNDLYNSDHFPLCISQTSCANGISRPSKYIYDAADWFTYKNLANITRNMVNGNIEDSVALVTETIIKAADASIPKSSTNPPKNRKPWWNMECYAAIKEQKRAWNIFRRYPNNDNFIAFKRAKAIARRV